MGGNFFCGSGTVYQDVVLPATVRCPAFFGAASDKDRHYGTDALVQQYGTDALVQQYGTDALVQQYGTDALVQQYGTDALVQQYGH